MKVSIHPMVSIQELIDVYKHIPPTKVEYWKKYASGKWFQIDYAGVKAPKKHLPRKTLEKICPSCKETFLVSAARIQREKVCCSRTCSAKHRWAIIKESGANSDGKTGFGCKK